MANLIATQSDAYSVGGTKPSGYVANKCCTNAMAISCGCADPGYASKRLVPSNILEADGLQIVYRLTLGFTDLYYSEVTFQDHNLNQQKLTLWPDDLDKSNSSITITYTGDKSADELVEPAFANGGYRETATGTLSVGIVNWSKSVASTGSRVTFTAQVATDNLGGSGDQLMPQL